MKLSARNRQKGHVSGALIAVILLGLALVMVIGLSIWLFIQYNDQKSNVDSKVEVAVAKAVRDTREEDETKFAEREKEPNLQFVGPEDYGRLAFMYPKTWSVYVDTDVTGGGNYEAYLHPVAVPPVKGADERFALRVLIEEKEYNDIVSSYDTEVKKGDLKSRTFSANGERGTRLDGNFSKDVRGAVVIFKVRDKTISIFTDADTFKPDFEKIIKTIEFNT